MEITKMNQFEGRITEFLAVRREHFKKKEETAADSTYIAATTYLSLSLQMW